MTPSIKGCALAQMPGTAPGLSVRKSIINQSFAEALQRLVGRPVVAPRYFGGVFPPEGKASALTRSSPAAAPLDETSAVEAAGDKPASKEAPGLSAGVVLDPLLGVLVPTLQRLENPLAAPAVIAAPAFAELWAKLVRKIAWGGDGRRTTARIEIGDGDWAGATIVVSAVAHQVAVTIDLPPGARVAEWRERIARRLEERGLDVAELNVRQ